MGLLEGKVAIVTGAGGGLGRSHALLLAQQGAAVVVNDLGGARDGSGGGNSMADAVVDEINAAGGKAAANYGSVTDAEAGEAMVKTALDNFGRVDILINNAGILRDKSFKNMDDAMWDAVIDVHLRGTYLVTKAVWKQFLAQAEGGRIVNTSSTSGLIGNFGQANYGAAKAGIAGFTRVLALEGMKSKITVNTLAPAAYSRMTEDLMPEGVADSLAPEKVSPPIVWLCSDEAAGITGQQFCVRGNRVSLLSWQVTEIAERDSKDAPWDVAEIGQKILASQDRWPKLLKAMDV